MCYLYDWVMCIGSKYLNYLILGRLFLILHLYLFHDLVTSQLSRGCVIVKLLLDTSEVSQHFQTHKCKRNCVLFKINNECDNNEQRFKSLTW